MHFRPGCKRPLKVISTVSQGTGKLIYTSSSFSALFFVNAKLPAHRHSSAQFIRLLVVTGLTLTAAFDSSYQQFNRSTHRILEELPLKETGAMSGSQYQQLSTAGYKDKESLDSEETLHHSLDRIYHPQSQKLRERLHLIIFALAVAFSLVVSLGLISHRLVLKIPGSEWTNCGSSVEEAHARNCLYDVMIGSWLLPECSDPELMENYLAERDWEFYKDEDLIETLPMDMLRLGEHLYPVYATIHQHAHHCAYVWEKQFRSILFSKKMDDLSGNTEHSHHCAQGLYTGMPGAKGNLGLEVKYFSCVKAGEGDTRRPNNPNNTIHVPGHGADHESYPNDAYPHDHHHD